MLSHRLFRHHLLVGAPGSFLLTCLGLLAMVSAGCADQGDQQDGKSVRDVLGSNQAEARKSNSDSPVRRPLGGDSVDVLPNRCLTTLTIDQDDVLWIGAEGGGVYAIRNGRLWLFDPYNSPIPDSAIVCGYIDRNNIKWFGSGRGYVYRREDREWQVLGPLPRPERFIEDRTELRQVFLPCLLENRGTACVLVRLGLDHSARLARSVCRSARSGVHGHAVHGGSYR